MVKSIVTAHYTMTATVITSLVSDGGANTGEGHYETYQDEDSNEIKTRFVAAVAGDPVVQTSTYDIPCYARGYTDLGFRSSANRETYLKGQYDASEAVEIHVPAKYDKITRQSFVTNIRDTSTGLPLWKEEETGEPTTFECQGLTPIFDPLGKLREWTGVITRAEVQ